MTPTEQRVLSGGAIGAGSGVVIGALAGPPAIGAAAGAGAGALEVWFTIRSRNLAKVFPESTLRMHVFCRYPPKPEASSLSGPIRNGRNDHREMHFLMINKRLPCD